MVVNESEIMADFDEDKYIDEFCNKQNCHSCEGTDQSGEPNGYGCDGAEQYVEQMYQHILKCRLSNQCEDYKQYSVLCQTCNFPNKIACCKKVSQN